MRVLLNVTFAVLRSTRIPSCSPVFECALPARIITVGASDSETISPNLRNTWYTTSLERTIVADKKKNIPAGPTPWGAEPIRGLDYNYLDIDKPAASDAKSIVPDKVPFNASQAQDYYTRVREKIVRWAEGAGADRDITSYVLLIPDLMALFVRLLADPRVAPA